MSHKSRSVQQLQQVYPTIPALARRRSVPAPRSSAYSGQLYRQVEAAYNTIACKLAKFSNPKALA